MAQDINKSISIIKKLIKEKYGTLTKFCKLHNEHQGNLSTLLGQKDPKRVITPSKILELEEKLGVPSGSILFPTEENPTHKIPIYYNDKFISNYYVSDDFFKNVKDPVGYLIKDDSLNNTEDVIAIANSKELEIINNKLYAIKINDEVIIRNLFSIGNQIIAKAMNPNYPEINLTNEYEILGRIRMMLSHL